LHERRIVENIEEALGKHFGDFTYRSWRDALRVEDYRWKEKRQSQIALPCHVMLKRPSTIIHLTRLQA